MQQNKSGYKRLKEHKGKVNENIRKHDRQTKRESSYHEYNIETQKTLKKKIIDIYKIKIGIRYLSLVDP